MNTATTAKEPRRGIRLAERDRAGLTRAFSEALPSGARVYLFGSRADLSKRGGDIDLLVHVPGISPEAARILERRLRRAIEAHLEEQRVDLLIAASLDGSASPFIALAAAEAVPLWP